MSNRLELRQLPKTDASLSALKALLVKVFNYSRRYPTKMKALKQVLKYTYTRINEFEKAEEARIRHEIELGKAKSTVVANALRTADIKPTDTANTPNVEPPVKPIIVGSKDVSSEPEQTPIVDSKTAGVAGDVSTTDNVTATMANTTADIKPSEPVTEKS